MVFIASQVTCPECNGLSSPQFRETVLPALLDGLDAKQRRELRRRMKKYDRVIERGEEEPCAECGGHGYLQQVLSPYPEGPHEIEVPQGWRQGTKPDFYYHGRCYLMALRYMLHHLSVEGLGFERMSLVHGVWNPDVRSGETGHHAWVELPEGVVFDPNRQRFYDQDSYYLYATPQARYPFGDAYALMMERGHAGPWHPDAS